MLRIKVLGCNGGSEKGKGLTSFLVNDTILIDAGNVVINQAVDIWIKELYLIFSI